MPQGTFFKPKFFEYMKEEFLACREGVGIIDMSSFSKIEVKVRRIDFLKILYFYYQNQKITLFFLSCK